MQFKRWRMLSTAWFLFYKVGSSVKDFSRKEKFRILHSCYSEKKFSKLYFYLSFNINIELTNNYITDDFEINKKNLTIRCYFWIFLALKVKNSSFLNGSVINIKNAVITKMSLRDLSYERDWYKQCKYKSCNKYGNFYVHEHYFLRSFIITITIKYF